MTVERNKVVWWGIDPHADIARELENRGLALVASENETSLYERDVRAVLLPYHARKGVAAIAARASRLRATVVDRGGSILVVTFNNADYTDAVLQTANLAEVAVVNGTTASIVAHECARLAPGRPPGDVLIDRARKTKLRPQDDLLLRRAFGDFKLIQVQALTGGLSGACILRVRATTIDGRKTMPFLVKAGPHRAITEEIDTTKQFVLDHVPFTNQPGLVEDRCVAGLDRRLLVSRFVEKANRFDDYLVQKRSVEKVIRSIFDGPLRNWRENAVTEKVSIGMVYSQRIRGAEGKHNAVLLAAHDFARSSDAGIASPMSLVEALERIPDRVVRLCQAHGDLHPRNIFVRDNSEEIILIDFAHANELQNPILRDAATLDVALAFDGWEREATRIAPDEIEMLYTPPIFGPKAEGLSHRAAAIVHVRQQAKIDAHSEAEYVEALITMLVRTARLLTAMDGDVTQRARLVATALRCAERLVKALP